MSIAEKLTTIAENEQKVYDAGKKAQYDEFWDDFQPGKGIEPDSCYGSFRSARWTDFTFNPKYRLYASTFMGAMHSNTNVTRVPVEIDWTALTEASDTQQAFYACSSLINIPKLKVAETTMYNANTFQACYALEELIVEGTIGQQNFDVHWSTKLTRESLLSIISALKDYSANASGTTHTVTLGATNLAKLTDEEKAIATQKGWTLA